VGLGKDSHGVPAQRLDTVFKDQMGYQLLDTDAARRKMDMPN
jgi:hypothetical protein